MCVGSHDGTVNQELVAAEMEEFILIAHRFNRGRPAREILEVLNRVENVSADRAIAVARGVKIRLRRGKAAHIHIAVGCDAERGQVILRTKDGLVADIRREHLVAPEATENIHGGMIHQRPRGLA